MHRIRLAAAHRNNNITCSGLNLQSASQSETHVAKTGQLSATTFQQTQLNPDIYSLVLTVNYLNTSGLLDNSANK